MQEQDIKEVVALYSTTLGNAEDTEESSIGLGFLQSD